MTDSYSKATVAYERIREIMNLDGEVKDLPGRFLCSIRKLVDIAAREALRERGEDPREFRWLYRDLIAIFEPRSQQLPQVSSRWPGPAGRRRPDPQWGRRPVLPALMTAPLPHLGKPEGFQKASDLARRSVSWSRPVFLDLRGGWRHAYRHRRNVWRRALRRPGGRSDRRFWITDR